MVGLELSTLFRNNKVVRMRTPWVIFKLGLYGHRIRHTGFLANGIRRDRIAKIRPPLNAETEPDQTPDGSTAADPDNPPDYQFCPKCGGSMIAVETCLRGQAPKSRAVPGEGAA